MWNELRSNGYLRGEIINRPKDAHLYPDWKTISSVKDNDGIVTNYVANFSNITELKNMKNN